MRYRVTQFESLEEALKEIAPFLRDGRQLQSGKPLQNFGGMLPREVWANWLVCVVVNAEWGGTLSFSSDPTGGDGIIRDCATGNVWPTEHVIVPELKPGQTGDAEALILKAVEQKCAKGGEAYASGKTLIVFLNAGAGEWRPNKVARQLPAPLYFETVWVVALQGVKNGEYVYGLTNLDVSKGNAPTYVVRINKEFTGCEVKALQ